VDRGDRKFLLKFDGEDDEIDLNYSENPEFKSWRWVEINDILANAVYFKKDLYSEVCNVFKSMISIIMNNYKILEN
jgi:putative (di)nucleoside polyphosphate hydrolase